jgi:peptide/nickel transport system permease protein
MTTTTVLTRQRPILFRRFAGMSPVVAVAAVVLCLIVLAAIFAPLLAPHDPSAIDLRSSFSGPSPSHPLGTDGTGRDILSRLLYGARISLAGPACVMFLAMIAAASLSLVAAWNGGVVDSGIARFLEVLFSFPGLILAVVAAAIFGAGFWAPVFALSLAYIPIMGRVLRSVALRERNLPYVAALQIQGVPSTRIAVRHMLPNLMPMMIVQIGVGYAYAMLDLSAISYLGLGLQPPTADWGVMVSEGQASIVEGYPQESLYAALAILVTVVCLNLVIGWIAERFDVTGVRA